VCAWCQGELQGDETGENRPHEITHRICARCRERVRAQSVGDSLRRDLDRLKFPVLVVDHDAVIRVVNSQAQALLFQEGRGVEGELVGDAIGCLYSYWPGGCGKTTRCPTCKIRGSVTATFATGKCMRHVLCYQEIRQPGGIERRRLLISSEKVNDVVLLRIDSVAKVPDRAKV
jgi:hypothetical protein